ncbi:hypothetical protein DFH09DRAFT_1474826 [Mycena vulgaris]|nr:hypothetical protein DFH09DRAFT_1474826 [Mycena vulgaris]
MPAKPARIAAHELRFGVFRFCAVGSVHTYRVTPRPARAHHAHGRARGAARGRPRAPPPRPSRPFRARVIFRVPTPAQAAQIEAEEGGGAGGFCRARRVGSVRRVGGVGGARVERSAAAGTREEEATVAGGGGAVVGLGGADGGRGGRGGGAVAAVGEEAAGGGGLAGGGGGGGGGKSVGGVGARLEEGHWN